MRCCSGDRSDESVADIFTRLYHLRLETTIEAVGAEARDSAAFGAGETLATALVLILRGRDSAFGRYRLTSHLRSRAHSSRT